MNKKISTLMAGGFLLTSVFASAQIFNRDAVQLVDDSKGVPAGRYFVVLQSDGNTTIDDNDYIMSVVEENGKLCYRAFYVKNLEKAESDKSWQAGLSGIPTDKENLLWNIAVTPDLAKGNYYSFYNEGVKSYLSFKSDNSIIDNPSDCSDILNDAAKGFSYFITAFEDATGLLKNGSALYLFDDNNASASHRLQNQTSDASIILGGDASAPTICFYKATVQPADLSDIELMNKTMAGEGFNLTFTGLDKHETNVIYNQKFKAFEVPSNLEVNLGDEGATHIIPAGFYLATSYPDNLIGTNQITKTEDFLACTFLAVDPTINKKINAVKPSDGHGFEFTLVAARDMNYVEDINKDQATIQGQIYVGNACFAIEIPDFAITILTVSFIILLSDFSHVFSPQNSSSKHWSKYFARGPFASFGPTIEATSVIHGGLSNFIVCFPNFFIDYLPFKFNCLSQFWVKWGRFSFFLFGNLRTVPKFPSWKKENRPQISLNEYKINKSHNN